MHRGEMLSWVNDTSNLVFVGDSCHPMLPYLAQGANSSIEDGAVLGLLLGQMKSKSQLSRTLKTYEALRKKRGEAIVRETFRQRQDFHMPNGPEQEARDKLFLSRLGKEDEKAEPFPSRWSVLRYSLLGRQPKANKLNRTCPVVQPWLYGYDAVKEVEEAVNMDPDFSRSRL